MDPLSIVVASEGLVGTCNKLSGYITWLNKTQVNTTIGILRVEIDSLSHVFASISTNFGNRSLGSLAPHTKLEERHWTNVRQSMNDCKETLEKLHEMLQPVVKQKRGVFFKKSVKVIELDLNPNEMAILQQQVMAYRKTMEISLQVMTLYVPPPSHSLYRLLTGQYSSSMLSTEALHANLSSIFNQLTHIQQLLRLFREQTKHDISIISNLEKCAWSAGKLVSTTRSSIYLPNDQVENSSEAGDELKDLQNRRIANWLPEVSAVEKEEFNIDSNPKRLANEDFHYGHRSTAPSIDSTPSTLQRSDTHDSQSDVSLANTKRQRIHRKEDSNDTTSDVDIQQWLKSGIEQFTAKDYEKAEASLQRVLRRSQSKHGVQFAWRDETIRMLVVIYCNLGNWVEAKELLNQKFADKDKTLETLAAKFCQERRWDDAGWLLRYQFEGRETVMERVARAYVLDQKWSQAKKTLLELIKYKAEESIRGLERMYILAEVCHWKGDLEDTKEWCLTALQGPKTVLEKLHPLFHQFVKLLVQACEDQHDMVGAEKYRALLSSDVQECAEIEQLSLMRPKEAAVEFEKCFKDISLGSAKQRKSIRENIKRSGKGIVGTGRGWALIHAFATNGRESAAQLLLEKGADIEARDEEGNTPLNCAAANGHESTVRMLLEMGADHKSKNKLGNPPLMSATLKGSEKVVRVLLKEGADIEARDRDQNTLLISAVMDGYSGIVKLLIEKGGNIEAQNQAGRTPLMIAVLLGDEERTRLLIEKKANIEAKDNEGNTPLMIAASKEHVTVLELLLYNGANIDARNNNGSTALALAKRSGVYRTQTVRRLMNTQNYTKLQHSRSPSRVGTSLSRTTSHSSFTPIDRKRESNDIDVMEVPGARVACY